MCVRVSGFLYLWAMHVQCKTGLSEIRFRARCARRDFYGTENVTKGARKYEAFPRDKYFRRSEWK